MPIIVGFRFEEMALAACVANPQAEPLNKMADAARSRLTIEGHADVTGLRVRYQKVRPVHCQRD